MADCNKTGEPPTNVWDWLREHESSAWAVGVCGALTAVLCTTVICVAWYNVEALRHPPPELELTVTTKRK